MTRWRKVSQGKTWWCEGPEPSVISTLVFSETDLTSQKNRFFPFFVLNFPNSVTGGDLHLISSWPVKPPLTKSPRSSSMFFLLHFHCWEPDAESGPPYPESRVNHPAATSNLSSLLIDLNWIPDCHPSATFHEDVLWGMNSPSVLKLRKTIQDRLRSGCPARSPTQKEREGKKRLMNLQRGGVNNKCPV